MKKLTALLTVIGLLLSLCSCTVKRQRTSDAEQYRRYLSKVEYAASYMPDIAACGDPSSMTATYQHDYLLFFDKYSVGLFLAYTEDEYEAQKQAILSSYTFFDAEDEVASDRDAAVGGFDLRLVDAEYPLSTVKTGLLIGTNDADCEICYLFYYDFDLDVLDDLDAYVSNHIDIP